MLYYTGSEHVVEVGEGIRPN